jgi:hypothetical protein
VPFLQKKDTSHAHGLKSPAPGRHGEPAPVANGNPPLSQLCPHRSVERPASDGLWDLQARDVTVIRPASTRGQEGPRKKRGRPIQAIRAKADCARNIQQTEAADPKATWILEADNLTAGCAETLRRFVAKAGSSTLLDMPTPVLESLETPNELGMSTYAQARALRSDKDAPKATGSGRVVNEHAVIANATAS